MGKYSRAEIEQAFDRFQAVSRRAAEEGNWNLFADLFTQDATYVEHEFGTFEGREAIRDWICKTMADHRGMSSFPVEWSIIDEERGWVVLAAWNRMIDPGDGSLHQAASWSLLKYAGDGQWSYEEDIYNPREFEGMLQRWAGAKKKALEEKGSGR